MYKEKTVAVVVPTYNEEKLVTRVLETIPDFVDTIVVVDDGSNDQTCAVVEECRTRLARHVELLCSPENRGVGGAIAEGYRWCRDGEIDVTVVMAGDAQMDPSDLPALLDPVVAGEVDYAKGNRLVSGEAWQRIPRVRYLGNAGLSLLTKIASGYWHVADSQTGYTAANLRVLKTIDLDSIYRRYGMPNDILVKLNIYGFRVRDVEIHPVYGIGERSGIKPIRMIPRLAWLLLRLFVWRMVQKYVIRDFHPLIFFYLLGFLLFSPGLTLGIYLLVRRLFWGPVAATSALFATLLLISGLQFLLFAMWFDMEYNKHLR